jgi:hypothetical protein
MVPFRLISDDNLRDFSSQYPRLAHMASSAAGEKTFGAILQGITVIGVAGTMSYMNARHAAAGRQAYEVAGVPADLALGVLFSGLALTGYFGDHAKHAHNVGNGFLCAYACRMGTMWGGAAKTQLNGVAPRAAFPAPPAGSPYHATETAPVAAGAYPWAA